jgi:hypothetical protein
MTTFAPTAPLPTRLSRVIRLHMVNPITFIGIPLIVMGSAWIISAAVFSVLGATLVGATPADLQESARSSWAVLSPLWYLISAGALAFAGTFPFALGMGSTRRDFHLGTSLLFVVVSAGFAGLTTALAALERVTSGWGIGNWMFNALWIGLDSVALDFFGLFVLYLFVLFMGAAGASLWMRWRAIGVLGFVLVCAATLVAIVAAIGFSTGGWASFFTWASTIGLAGMFAVLFAPVGVLFVVSFIMIRFATPRD